ncbi:hypothetical protein [Shewanella sp. Isolate8]|uniref:hypothetical protein n=1 Tax=Shewanella sp. Isolate8 TaxID=2908529 RepID=UPI001EFDFE2F|nr:hypothetical protein [Shewanella sp. Isolate8]MCG9745236.1 hypothetical protein [Shewanella sp. Isolate8]
MEQKIIIKNRFFSLLGESLRLLNEAEKCDDETLKNCLITSSILTCAYSLEAAANSVLETVEPKVSERDYSTLGKFTLGLEHHLDKKMNKGCPEYQNVKALLEHRNEHVHPKVFTKDVKIQTKKSDDDFSWHHKSIEKEPKKRNLQNISSDSEHWQVSDAKIAIKAVIEFLNIYVCEWWGLDESVRDYVFLPQSNIAKNGETRMYDINTLKMLKTYESSFTINFISIPALPEGCA